MADRAMDTRTKPAAGLGSHLRQESEIKTRNDGSASAADIVGLAASLYSANETQELRRENERLRRQNIEMLQSFNRERKVVKELHDLRYAAGIRSAQTGVKQPTHNITAIRQHSAPGNKNLVGSETLKHGNIDGITVGTANQPNRANINDIDTSTATGSAAHSQADTHGFSNSGNSNFGFSRSSNQKETENSNFASRAATAQPGIAGTVTSTTARSAATADGSKQPGLTENKNSQSGHIKQNLGKTGDFRTAALHSIMASTPAGTSTFIRSSNFNDINKYIQLPGINMSQNNFQNFQTPSTVNTRSTTAPGTADIANIDRITQEKNFSSISLDKASENIRRMQQRTNLRNTQPATPAMNVLYPPTPATMTPQEKDDKIAELERQLALLRGYTPTNQSNSAIVPTTHHRNSSDSSAGLKNATRIDGNDKIGIQRARQRSKIFSSYDQRDRMGYISGTVGVADTRTSETGIAIGGQTGNETNDQNFQQIGFPTDPRLRNNQSNSNNQTSINNNNITGQKRAPMQPGSNPSQGIENTSDKLQGNGNTDAPPPNKRARLSARSKTQTVQNLGNAFDKTENGDNVDEDIMVDEFWGGDIFDPNPNENKFSTSDKITDNTNNDSTHIDMLVEVEEKDMTLKPTPGENGTVTLDTAIDGESYDASGDSGDDGSQEDDDVLGIQRQKVKSRQRKHGILHEEKLLQRRRERHKKLQQRQAQLAGNIDKTTINSEQEHENLAKMIREDRENQNIDIPHTPARVPAPIPSYKHDIERLDRFQEKLWQSPSVRTDNMQPPNIDTSTHQETPRTQRLNIAVTELSQKMDTFGRKWNKYGRTLQKVTQKHQPNDDKNGDTTITTQRTHNKPNPVQPDQDIQQRLAHGPHAVPSGTGNDNKNGGNKQDDRKDTDSNQNNQDSDKQSDQDTGNTNNNENSNTGGNSGGRDGKDGKKDKPGRDDDSPGDSNKDDDDDNSRSDSDQDGKRKKRKRTKKPKRRKKGKDEQSDESSSSDSSRSSTPSRSTSDTGNVNSNKNTKRKRHKHKHKHRRRRRYALSSADMQFSDESDYVAELRREREERRRAHEVQNQLLQQLVQSQLATNEQNRQNQDSGQQKQTQYDKKLDEMEITKTIKLDIQKFSGTAATAVKRQDIQLRWWYKVLRWVKQSKLMEHQDNKVPFMIQIIIDEGTTGLLRKKCKERVMKLGKFTKLDQFTKFLFDRFPIDDVISDYYKKLHTLIISDKTPYYDLLSQYKEAKYMFEMARWHAPLTLQQKYVITEEEHTNIALSRLPSEWEKKVDDYCLTKNDMECHTLEELESVITVVALRDQRRKHKRFNPYDHIQTQSTRNSNNSQHPYGRQVNLTQQRTDRGYNKQQRNPHYRKGGKDRYSKRQGDYHGYREKSQRGKQKYGNRTSRDQQRSFRGSQHRGRGGYRGRGRGASRGRGRGGSRGRGKQYTQDGRQNGGQSRRGGRGNRRGGRGGRGRGGHRGGRTQRGQRNGGQTTRRLNYIHDPRWHQYSAKWQKTLKTFYAKRQCNECGIYGHLRQNCFRINYQTKQDLQDYYLTHDGTTVNVVQTTHPAQPGTAPAGQSQPGSGTVNVVQDGGDQSHQDTTGTSPGSSNNNNNTNDNNVSQVNMAQMQDMVNQRHADTMKKNIDAQKLSSTSRTVTFVNSGKGSRRRSKTHSRT